MPNVLEPRHERRDPAAAGTREVHALTSLQERVNRLFDEMWLKIGTQHHGFSGRALSHVPTDADLGEGKEDLRLEIDLPGVDVEDLEVLAGDGELTVRGEKKVQRQEAGRDYHLEERTYGAFARAFRLPPGFDAARATADYRNGVLNITIPRIPGTKSAVKKVLIKGA